MQFLSHYGMFLLEVVTLVIAILALFTGIVAIAAKNKSGGKGKIVLTKLNDKFQEQQEDMQSLILHKKELKELHKENKKKKKTDEAVTKKRLFVINFVGDIRAHAVENLRQEINALLTIATPADEVLVVLESGGGVVHGYGLGASQLERIRQKQIPLTVAVDKVAASGGYLMACVADKIIAAPFAIIGSIGVLAQIPNFHRLLKKSNIDFEQITAGEFKRTLTMFGENTDKGREKMREDIQLIHDQFKNFILANRANLDIEKVATGEYWLAKKALEFNLVDSLQTSDDFLLSKWQDVDLFEIKFQPKKSLSDKLGATVKMGMEKFGLVDADEVYYFK